MNAQELEDLWELLNATDPQQSLEEYLLIKTWSKRKKEAFRRKFRNILFKAKQDHIPMGIERGNCLSYEDAYLLRQRFLNKFFKQEETFQTITGLVLLMLFGLTFIILTLIFT